MFERFTDRARRVLVLGQEEAKALHHNFLGTEHILLGMALEGEGVGGRVLANIGLTPDRIRDAIRERMPSGGVNLFLEDADALAAIGIDLDEVKQKVEVNFGEGALDVATTPPPKFTPKGKRVLELAYEAALDLVHNYIGTEHLLLGLLSLGDGVGPDIVTSAAPLDAVRDRVHALLAEHMPADPRPEMSLEGLYYGDLDLAPLVVAAPRPAETAVTRFSQRAAGALPTPSNAGDPAKLRDAFANGRALLFDLRDTEALMTVYIATVAGLAAGLGAELKLLAPGIYLVKDPTTRLTPELRRRMLDGLLQLPA